MHLPRAIEIQPRLPVSALVPSYRFYRDVLGFECPDGEPLESAGFAILQRDTIGLQLVTAGPDHPAGQMTVWIHVADALAEHDRMKAHTPIEWGPEVYWYGCREFAVLDPDGHSIIFSSPTDEPPTCREEDP
ncbi:VOC family protein [Luteolibacter soli]|uniref:VOC family protein n=1 Tax=Luteolibacter soli TaxID=3135280 RepID=A0ABU9AZK9_9BACT